MAKPKVLVIDDQQDIQDALKMVLEYEGYRYISALTGQQGLQVIEEEHPDVIFLDIKMPNMDGNEVFDILKMKGSIKAMAVGPPRPGKMPTTKPTAIPIIIRLKVDQLKT